jgi:hypothetical protein
MREQTRQRFLSIGLAALVAGTPIMQNAGVTVSAGQPSAMRATTQKTILPDDGTAGQRQASLAGVLGLDPSELVPGRWDAPYRANPFADSGADQFWSYISPFEDPRSIFGDWNAAAWDHLDLSSYDEVLSPHPGHSSNDYIICGAPAQIDVPRDGADPNPDLGSDPDAPATEPTESTCSTPAVGPAPSYGQSFRIRFNYDSQSISGPDYRNYLWQEWNRYGGRSLSTAFLEANWRISNRLSPVVEACGATEGEATARLNTERFLTSRAVSCDWKAWRWYSVQRPLIDGGMATLSLPLQLDAYPVKKGAGSDAEAAAVARAVGIDLVDLSMIENRPFGFKAIKTPAVTLVVEPDGDYTLFVDKAAPRGDARELPDSELIERARNIVETLRLAEGKKYEFGLVRYSNENSGSASSPQGTPRIYERTVVFDQVIDGMRFIDPDAGHIEISFDALTGSVRRINGTLRSIVPSSGEVPASVAVMSIEEAREQALKSVSGERFEVITGSESVGYQILNGEAAPVYRASIYNPNEPSASPRQAIVPLLKSQ